MPETGVDIRVVRSPVDAEAVRELVWEFFDYLRYDFPDRGEMIDKYLQVQNVAAELAELLQRFVPPDGECLLALLDGKPVGTLMLKRIDDDICEMNRMWVKSEARGRGAGRELIEALCDRAREMNFQFMRLEALDERIPAVPLYQKLGFVTNPDRSPYATQDQRVIALIKTLRENK
ncbi:MAG: GNAT family N-acetyltransferase [Boseongicola sp.]